MTAGSSLVRPIKWFMEDLFGENTIKSKDNFSSVSEGLGIKSAIQYQTINC